ncbi:hypothetical protein RJT34_08940 [Clitoria ternatea]|uniref:Folate-biopterin transporter 2 n=1 Tax=Clitoria ternatea TaxID=43366 RepID=A0AAN9K6T8_CLITE
MQEEENQEDPYGESMVEESESTKGFWGCFCIPIHWFRMLSREMHWSFVFGVVVVYGISQGLGGALAGVGTKYYMKDVQKVQPSEAQVYAGITSIPWIVKPIWGLLTDVLPFFGYRRRPYFIFAGFLGVIAMLLLSLHENLHLVLALLALTAGSAGAAIADVTIDACVAQNSISHPLLATDMQSLCASSHSVGALVGFFISGIFVHLIGPMGVFGLMTIPAGLIILVGFLLDEPRMHDSSYRQVKQNFVDAGKAMWKTLRSEDVWKPCLYMYLSIALSLNIPEGMFYWYTDSKNGPSFSQESIGFIYSISSVGALLGAILYQYALKDYAFRDLLFWTQLFFGLSGMLDMILVLRWNIKFGIPDYFFVVIVESIAQMTNRLKWMPMLVLSSKLCPSGIEGTFFALLMSIDNVGVLSASWGGGFVLHILNITRTRFDNLWLAILIRNILRITPIALLFLVPRADPNSSILPSETMDSPSRVAIDTSDTKNVELVSLVHSVDGK